MVTLILCSKLVSYLLSKVFICQLRSYPSCGILFHGLVGYGDLYHTISNTFTPSLYSPLVLGYGSECMVYFGEQ